MGSGNIDGIRVMDEDWDNLVVLDACRADLFREEVELGSFSDYRTVTSCASATWEWTQCNFSGRQFGDTVYVSGNPFTSEVAGDCFHDLVEVWRTDFDESVGTVRPEPVFERALEAAERYPHKRLIVHFMQPHHPFLGHEELQYGSIAGIEQEDSPVSNQPKTVWEALDAGLVSETQVREGYQDNLALVMESVSELINKMNGKTVITSDHGNVFGDVCWPIPLRLYGHPGRVRLDGLLEVPWATIDSPSRREIVNEGVEEVSAQADNLAKERLEALGYH